MTCCDSNLPNSGWTEGAERTRARNDLFHRATNIDRRTIRVLSTSRRLFNRCAWHSPNEAVEAINRIADTVVELRHVAVARVKHAIRHRSENQRVKACLCQGSAFCVAGLQNSLQFLQDFPRHTATSVCPDLPLLLVRERTAQGFCRRHGKCILIPKCHASVCLRDAFSISQSASTRAPADSVMRRSGRAAHWDGPAGCYSEIDSRNRHDRLRPPVGCRGAVAQLVEQRPFKPWVPGSSPGRLTTPIPVARAAPDFLPKKLKPDSD